MLSAPKIQLTFSARNNYSLIVQEYEVYKGDRNSLYYDGLNVLLVLKAQFFI